MNILRQNVYLNSITSNMKTNYKFIPERGSRVRWLYTWPEPVPGCCNTSPGHPRPPRGGCHKLFSPTPYFTHKQGSFHSDRSSQCGCEVILREWLVPGGILNLPDYPNYPQPPDHISAICMFHISTFANS